MAMTVSPADRIYFTDPIQRPTTKLPENARIVVSDSANPYRNTAVRGDIIPVTGLVMGSIERWYWLGADQNHYRGVLLNAHTIRRSRWTVSFIGDDAVLGYLTNRDFNANTFTFTDSRWFSGRRDSIGGRVIDAMRFTDVAPAASWATDLWPNADDTEELVQMKITLAKEKWEMRRKKGAILEEGMYRDWLTRLEEKEFYTTHGMPRPTFGAFVEAEASVDTGTRIERSELTPQQQNAVNALGSLYVSNRLALATSIRIPVRVVHEPYVGYTTKTEVRNATPADITARVQELTDNYGLDIAAITARYPILVSAS
jgi:hypothetical protein